MKTALSGLLALSLVANVALFALTRRASPPPPSVAPSTAPVTASSSVSGATPAAAEVTTTPTTASSPAKPMIWRRGTSDEALRALADDLRAAGFPPRAINAAVAGLFYETRYANSPGADKPFWQMYSNENQAEARAYYREFPKKLDDILGPDAKLSAQLDPIARQRRYGNLSDEKIDALKLVERDYQELQQDIDQATFSRTPTQEDFAARQQKTNLLKQEISTDLASVLTPAELEAYEMRTSDSARQLSSTVRDIDLAEDEFTALYRLQKSFDEANPRLTGVTTADQAAKRRTDQQAMTEQVKAVLGDDRFYQYLGTTDTNYRELTKLAAQYPAVTPQAAYQVTQLQLEAQQTMRTLSRNRQTNPDEINAAFAVLNTRLESLVGPAAAAIKKQNSGRVFNAPVITPRPAQPDRK